ncbi:site-specific DNA-methyltransferase [Salinisphaera aquimarina]|uniref:site-specific DNA-methyltransferase (adenine-specific) n=1 Tax=Salinisphaera aquimarina TaxID=2094031 RepID=A0ABV7EQH4_9GAMM
MAKSKNTAPKSVETLTHEEARRKNIPTAEHQSIVDAATEAPLRVAYERRNRDLDPQLVWRGKDRQDAADLTVNAPPLYIQEKVHPKALIDDLQRESREREHDDGQATPDLFSDFNGLPKGADRTEFYKFDANWQNRMILGDSLQVMASLAEREGLRGQVQCIYLDPPYGIKFNSNFQWSTTSRDVKDGKADHITREPEQVKAFRDTWRDGIHSYLTYLRDRLTVARDLLHESGSIFVQIGDENIHRVRTILDEVFGPESFISSICLQKTGGQETNFLPNVSDYILWYGKNSEKTKYRQVYLNKELGKGKGSGSRYDRIQISAGNRRALSKLEKSGHENLPDGSSAFQLTSLISSGIRTNTTASWVFRKRKYHSGASSNWKTSLEGLARLAKADRIENRRTTVAYVRYIDDFPAYPTSNIWTDVAGASGIIYVVQTSATIVRRCLQMATDPGDLVLDPTCGSGTTATVAEQWGRRWITIDTSRVALALARARVMGARYPYYLLADSPEGQKKEAEITRNAPSTTPTRGNIRQGFVYERVPHITLKSIANNAEIDVVWERFQETLEPLRQQLNAALDETWEEWEIPREADNGWSEDARKAHAEWWQQRIARQQEIDASIAAKADSEYLYDKPYEDKKKVRVAGPFTVESISPHRTLGVDENDELIDPLARKDIRDGDDAPQDFVSMILDNLKTAGVQQAHKDGAIHFTALTPWPGDLVCADGRYIEGEDDAANEKRAAIFIGPEFGTVSRPDLVEAAKEAAEADFDVLICCAFNYAAHATEFEKLGRIPVLKARMNADLHMAEDLKNTGKGNLFVIFGEPDIEIHEGASAALEQAIARRTAHLTRLDQELADRKAKKTQDDNTRPVSEIRSEKERAENFIAFAPSIPAGKIVVEVKGVDVFHPNSGEVRSDGPDGIACWFIDTDYNSESFFVRHAYFLGAADPYKSLRTTLKAEINEEAWDTLHSDTSRAFDKPKSGRIAVKVINHLGDEVMKVFRA